MRLMLSCLLTSFFVRVQFCARRTSGSDGNAGLVHRGWWVCSVRCGLSWSVETVPRRTQLVVGPPSQKTPRPQVAPNRALDPGRSRSREAESDLFRDRGSGFLGALHVGGLSRPRKIVGGPWGPGRRRTCQWPSNKNAARGEPNGLAVFWPGTGCSCCVLSHGPQDFSQAAFVCWVRYMLAGGHRARVGPCLARPS